ncbi:MAG: MoaD/ThiS family protein [Candidatus Lokiarchaeota archaeon]|nr:MoaD/ThiS family protein [Candidatus Lokiarchaeota archaeon]
MIIKITTLGVLSHILPNGSESIEGIEFTIQEMLDVLVNKYGNRIAEELFKKGKLKKELSLLINGRNVLSMPNKFRTVLKDEDEIMITTVITGG